MQSSGLLCSAAVHVFKSALSSNFLRMLAATLRRAPNIHSIVIALHNTSTGKPLLSAAIGVNFFVRIEPAMQFMLSASINPAGSQLMFRSINMQHHSSPFGMTGDAYINPSGYLFCIGYITP